MRFSFLTNAALFSLAILGRAENSCDEGPFAKNSPAGGRSGHIGLACLSKWENGEIIIGIEAWSAKFQVKAVRVKYSRSGWSDVIGEVPENNIEQHEIKEWGAGDEVGIKLWGNKPDDGDLMDAVGRVIITQAGNTIFEVGANKGKTASQENVGDNGSGLILGVKAGGGAWLDYIEFKMLKSKVMRSELVEVKPKSELSDVNKKQEGIKSQSIDTMVFANENPKGGSGMSYEISKSRRERTEKSITQETTNEWAAGVSVTVGASVGIPFLQASVETTASYEYRNSQFNSESLTEEKEEELSYTFASDPEVPLPPQKAALCNAMATVGQYNEQYDGKIEVTLADGSKYTYVDRGDVKSVGWSMGVVSCKQIELSEIPSEVPKGETKEVKVDTPKDNTDTPEEDEDAETTKPETDPKEDETTDKPLDESGEEALNETIDEPLDETTDEPLDETIDEPLDETTDESLDETIDEPLDETTDEPLDETTDETADEAVEQPLDESTDSAEGDPTSEEMPTEIGADVVEESLVPTPTTTLPGVLPGVNDIIPVIPVLPGEGGGSNNEDEPKPAKSSDSADSKPSPTPKPSKSKGEKKKKGGKRAIQWWA